MPAQFFFVIAARNALYALPASPPPAGSADPESAGSTSAENFTSTVYDLPSIVLIGAGEKTCPSTFVGVLVVISAFSPLDESSTYCVIVFEYVAFIETPPS